MIEPPIIRNRYYPGNSRSAFYPKMGFSPKDKQPVYSGMSWYRMFLSWLTLEYPKNKFVLLRLEVWLRIDDFVQLFDTVYECRLALWSEQKNRQQDFPGAGGICQIYTPEKSNPELTQNASNRHKGDNCPCSKVIKCTYLCYQVKCPVDMVNKSHHLPVSSWLTFNVVVCLCRWNQEGFANTPSSRRFLGVLFPPIPLACPSLPKEKAQNQTTS